MDMAGRRVLLVDDERDIVRTFTLFLERKGYVLDSAGSGREAEVKLGEHAYDVVVFDYRLPDISGAELSRRVDERVVTLVFIRRPASAALTAAGSRPSTVKVGIA